MNKSGTENLLRQALVRLCLKEPFAKISVKEITEEAGINRQTFYYHYKDKEMLLKEVYYHDCLHYLDQEISLDNWEEQTLLLLKAIYQKSAFYQNTLSSSQEALFHDFSELIEARFLDLFSLLDQDKILLAEDKNFYAGFFADGCSGVLKKWLQTGLKEQPIEMAARLFRLAKDVEFFAMRLYDGYEN
ncbi:TetR/AcrR family transcriptional regulator [Enterococcus timonensis]|uniref:TetR/AcrR family transcriptional regulator n=1 Tax=Enterococcus timonensis TaxID=1852364 RepID=UPI0008D9B2FC|nr:TetR/AcrR family transcriptional regulator [Enterococcus timonensis]